MKKRVHRRLGPIQADQFDESGPRSFECPFEYEPGRDYIRQEIIDLIKPHAELLCFFVECARVKRGVVGIDFDGYDPVRRMAPVYVMAEAEAKLLAGFEGAAFGRAYRQSGYGRSIIVTFTGEWWRGWFVLKWQTPQYRFESNGEASDGVD
jgi:hypothetical protein